MPEQSGIRSNCVSIQFCNLWCLTFLKGLQNIWFLIYFKLDNDDIGNSFLPLSHPDFYTTHKVRISGGIREEKETSTFTVINFPKSQTSFPFSDCSNYIYKSMNQKNVFQDKASRYYLKFTLPQGKKGSCSPPTKLTTTAIAQGICLLQDGELGSWPQQMFIWKHGNCSGLHTTPVLHTSISRLTN